MVFTESRKYDTAKQLQIPCGQCAGCRLERSRQWAIRCMHEASQHEHNSFVTLTYDDQHLPKNGGLQHRHFQLFMKRLRKNTGVQTRYYMAGEYGEQKARPHYHACLFGIHFQDRTYYAKTETGANIYTSATLDKLWGLGLCTIGDVTFESAAYCARYIMKKVTGKQAEKHYQSLDLETGEITQLQPEYNAMSRRPGIGKGWIDKYKTDVYPWGTVIVRGTPTKAPRFYDQQYEKTDPYDYDEMKFKRQQEGKKRYQDNTPERLKVKETIQLARLTQLKRKI